MYDKHENWAAFPCRPRISSLSARLESRPQYQYKTFKTNYTAAYGRYPPHPMPRTVYFPESIIDPESRPGSSRPGTRLSSRRGAGSRPPSGMSSMSHKPSPSPRLLGTPRNPGEPKTTLSRPSTGIAEGIKAARRTEIQKDESTEQDGAAPAPAATVQSPRSTVSLQSLTSSQKSGSMRLTVNPGKKRVARLGQPTFSSLRRMGCASAPYGHRFPLGRLDWSSGQCVGLFNNLGACK
jgi:hypothetical protein